MAETYFEKTFMKLKPEEAAGAMRSFTIIERTLINVLYGSQVGLSIREIRVKIVNDISNHLLIVDSANKAEKPVTYRPHYWQGLIFNPSPETWEKYFSDFNNLNAQHEKGKMTTTKFDDELARIIVKYRFCELPGYSTIEKALKDLQHNGFIEIRPLTDSKKKFIAYLNPKFRLCLDGIVPLIRDEAKQSVSLKK